MDEGLKIRLVGALVLLALLAIAWPFVFDSAEEIQLSKESQIPQPPAVQEWQAESRESPDPNRLGWENAAPESSEQKAEASATEDSSDKVATTEDNGPALREAWSVRVATLSDLDNGNKLVEKLIKDGFRAYGRKASGDEGEIMRIYVGPKFDKRRADSIKLKIDKLYSVKSLVVRYKPEEK